MLSICIPTYNRANCLLRLLNNIYNEYSDDVKVVVVNDGSKDGTINVVESFFNKMSISLYSQENAGRASALKRAILSCSTQFTILMDDEDLFIEGGLNLILEHLRELKNNQKHLSGIVFLAEDFNKSLIGSKFPIKSMITNLVKINADFKVKGDKKQVIRTDLLKAVMYENPFNERRVPTYLLWSRIAKTHNTLFLNKTVVYKDYLEGGMSANINRLRMQSSYSSRLLYKEIAELSVNIYKSKLYRLKHVLLFHKYNFRCSNSLQCDVNFIYNLAGFCIGYFLYLIENHRLSEI